MAKAKVKAKKTVKKSAPSHPRRGLVYALLAIPLGIAAWLFLWQFGFIASVVAWGIAAGALWFYKLGSKSEVSHAAAPWLIAIILFAVFAAFVSGLVADLWKFAVNDAGEYGDQPVFWSNDFWTYVWDNITYWDFLVQYWLEFIFALVFAALGAGNVLWDLFKKK